MLRLGNNEYELVRVHSGFSVTLFPPGEDVMKRLQKWELVACYVPRDDRYTLRADGEREYLRLIFQSEEYAVSDWRNLSGLNLDKPDTEWFGWSCMENLLVGLSEKESWSIVPGWLEVEPVRDYLFHCEFNGYRKFKDGADEAMEFKDDLPFAEATAYVPINAADPEATARAMAARTVRLTEFAGSKIRRYDPTQKSWLNIHINTHHRVTLQTPWRRQLA